MELTTVGVFVDISSALFMMSKIQNLNGTHNSFALVGLRIIVVYDVKDTKFEWNSQHILKDRIPLHVVYDVKDTKSDYRVQNTELYHTLK